MSGLESLLAGKTLVKRYEIEEVIGRGGFAAVYRAADLRLGRPVAVKIITFPAPDPETQARLHARFEREARSAASLPHHPNVVTVHDFGTDPETGIDFLVMELLKGETLAQYMAREGCPPLELSLQVLREAAEGLAVGHRSGLVHRDVKPGNVFLAEPHGEDPFRVVVVDFGIARIASEDESELTLTRTVAGENPHSPAYASPEQLAGERNLTAAADVFSLGVVAYQLLTGEKPFETGTGQRARGRAPVRPIRELNPSVPAAVVAVVERAMAQRPEDRYADAAEFAHAVDAAAAGTAERIVATTLPPPDDDATLIVPTASLGAAAAATAASAAPAAAPVPDDDHTVIAPPRRAAPPPPVEMPPSRPPDPPPARKRSPMGAFLLVLLLLAAGGAAAVWGLGGRGGSEEDPDPATPAVATEDTVIEGEIIDDGNAPAGTTGQPPSAGVVPPGGDDDGTGGDFDGVTPPAPDPTTGGGAPPSGGGQPAPAPPPASGQPSFPPAPAPAPPPAPSQPQPRPTPPPAQPIPQPLPPPAPAPPPPPAPVPQPVPRPNPPPILGRPVPPPAPPPLPNPSGPRDTIVLPTRPVALDGGPSSPGITP